MTPVAVPLIANLGPTEIILIILVLVLLFGAKKLPIEYQFAQIPTIRPIMTAIE